MAVASTFNNHIILVVLVNLGFRVTQHLRNLKKEVVEIEETLLKNLHSLLANLK